VAWDAQFLLKQNTAATINGIPQRAFLLPHSRPSFGRPKSSSALSAWTKRKHKDALTARATGWWRLHKRIIIMLLKLRPRVAKTGWKLEAVVYLWLFSGTNKWRGTRRRGKYVWPEILVRNLYIFTLSLHARRWLLVNAYKFTACVHWNHLVLIRETSRRTRAVLWFRLLRVIYAKQQTLTRISFRVRIFVIKRLW
jgi:hypothetical protein